MIKQMIKDHRIKHMMVLQKNNLNFLYQYNS